MVALNLSSKRSVNLHLIRHGETDENRLRIIQGQLDTELNEDGRRQAQIVAKRLKDVQFTHAFSSDSHRAVDTAAAILEHHPDVPLQATELLRERHMGVLQGVAIKPGERRPKLDDTAETAEQVIERVKTWWSVHVEPILLAPVTEKSATVLVVSHGATLSTLIVDFLLSDQMISAANGVVDRRLFNTSISEVEFTLFADEEKVYSSGVLKRYGDISHMLTPESAVKENVDDVKEVPVSQDPVTHEASSETA